MSILNPDQVNRPSFGCPTWCEDEHSHGYTSVLTDGSGRLHLSHSIELGTVEASTDLTHYGVVPDVFVCVEVGQTVEPDEKTDLQVGVPRIAIAATDYPHLTAAEAERLIDVLIAAVKQLDAITDSE